MERMAWRICHVRWEIEHRSLMMKLSRGVDLVHRIGCHIWLTESSTPRSNIPEFFYHDTYIVIYSLGQTPIDRCRQEIGP